MVPLKEFPKRSCSVSKDRHLHLQQIGVLMESCPGLVKRFQVVAARPLAKMRRGFVPGAMQPAAPGSFAEKPREQVKRERDSPERPGPEVPAWRSAQLALVFAAPIRRQLIPWRDQLGYERCLSSCRSNRKS